MTAHWVPESAQAAMATAATAVLPVPTSPRSRRFMGRGDAMSERMSSTAARCSPVRVNGRASRRAATWGPSTVWAKPGLPDPSSAWRALSTSWRQRSSS